METTIFKMFGPCKESNHDECAGETYLGEGWLICVCDCHEEWHPDRAYEAGYSYAAGYQD